MTYGPRDPEITHAEMDAWLTAHGKSHKMGGDPSGLVLHPSHSWGQRPIFERVEPGSNRAKWRIIPCCLDCLVDGWEDERDAFQPCRRAAKP